MAQELEISVGSSHTILCNHLKIRKVSARWMPYCLMSDQVECCLEVATHLLLVKGACSERDIAVVILFSVC